MNKLCVLLCSLVLSGMATSFAMEKPKAEDTHTLLELDAGLAISDVENVVSMVSPILDDLIDELRNKQTNPVLVMKNPAFQLKYNQAKEKLRELHRVNSILIDLERRIAAYIKSQQLKNDVIQKLYAVKDKLIAARMNVVSAHNGLKFKFNQVEGLVQGNPRITSNPSWKQNTDIYPPKSVGKDSVIEL